MSQHVKTLLAVMLAGSISIALLYLNAEGARVAANAYRELVPGVSTRVDVQTAANRRPLETEGSGDLRYLSEGNPALNDRFYFRGDKLALVTSASPDKRYLTRENIFERFGEPESHILFNTQEYLDYTEQGLRFICSASGRTTGALYFQPFRRRVPAGYPATRIDLRREPTTREPASGRPVNVPTDFRVGTAELSIAPQSFEKLTANDAKQPHLAEDLLARVAIFERGDMRIVLVGLDVFGMGTWDLNAMRDALRGQGYDRVVIAMSHTHANVDTIGFYGYYPAKYSKFVVKQTVAAVLRAAQKMQPVGSLQMGSVEMPLAGGRVVDLVRNGRDPGIVNPTVSIVQAVGTDGKPITNLVHLACHPEVIRLSNTGGLSPDFVGTLCRDVSRELGGQTVFLNGALGGMITPDTRFRTQAAAEEMGHSLASYVIQAAHAARPSGTHDVWMHRRTVEYPITAKAIQQFLKNAPGKMNVERGRAITEMNALWIGDAQFITVPGELLPEIGFEIEAKMTGHVRAIIGLANGQLGYLIPSYDFREGGYEERTGPGAAGGEITRTVGLELAPLVPPSRNSD
jgi:hypothetical protein